MTKEERAELLSHSKGLLPELPYADSPNPPMTGALESPTGGPTVHRSSTADLAPGVAPGSILASLRSPHGQTRASQAEIQLTDIITIGGTQTKLDTALKVGAVVKNAAGEYVFPDQSPTETAEKATEQAKVESEAAHINIVTPALQETFANLDNLFDGDGVQTEATVAAVLARTAKDGYEAGEAALHTRLRIAPDEAGTRNVQQAVEEGVRSTIAELARRGTPNGKEIIDHISSTMNPGDKASLALGVLHGSPEAFRRLAEIGKRLERHAAVGK